VAAPRAGRYTSLPTVRIPGRRGRTARPARPQLPLLSLPHPRSLLRGGGLLAALVIATVLLLARAEASRANPDPVDGFGLNVQTLLRSGGRVTDDRVAQLLGTMAGDGMHAARTDALWSYLEPGAPLGPTHRYDWSGADATAAALARAGIRWEPVLHGSPSWASSNPASLFAAPSPAHVADFAAFAAAFAARYGDGGRYWDLHPEVPRVPVHALEIWNEENTAEHWGAPPDPAAYADLFASAQAAIRAASPSTAVLVGGIVWNDDAAYLGAVLDHLGPDVALDGVAIHPYAPTVFSLLPNVRRMRRVLDAAGHADVPLRLNELGWPAAYDRAPAAHGLEGPVADATRAATLALTVDALSRSTCGVAGIDVYDAIESEDDPTHIESLMGVYRADGSATQTSASLWDAVARYRDEVAAGGPDRQVPVCGGRGGATRLRLLELGLDAVPRPDGCHVATVTYRGLPLEEARIRVTAPYVGVVESDANGQATICPSRPGGNAGLRITASVPGAATSNQEICDLPGGACRSVGVAAACALRHLHLKVSALRGVVARTAGCNPEIGGPVTLKTALVLPRRSARLHGFGAAHRDVALGHWRGVLAGAGAGAIVVPARLTSAGLRALRGTRRLNVLVEVTASEGLTHETVVKRATLPGRRPRR
jgi:hypothetical protein